MFHSGCININVCQTDGVYQKCIDFIVSKLNTTNNMWLNVFPQGRIQMPPEDWIRLKWGVGRIIAEAHETPLVLPYWHEGMNKILSVNEIRSAVLPKFGQKVTVVFGDVIDFAEQVRDMRFANVSPRNQRLHITNVIESELRLLKEKCQDLHNIRLMPPDNLPKSDLAQMPDVRSPTKVSSTTSASVSTTSQSDAAGKAVKHSTAYAKGIPNDRQRD